ncbi:hypothetical protein LR48_Vigan08g037100 [Vigna angularis]|uniref:Uncharacterized protein n=1 Tax=Phaseolus angularis TaxID=3914 RepID=A0A0L9V4C1_PHAAN|nr:hypothetical protein LR48_Vigan08g037100 [Vigna angularis]
MLLISGLKEIDLSVCRFRLAVELSWCLPFVLLHGMWMKRKNLVRDDGVWTLASHGGSIDASQVSRY